MKYNIFEFEINESTSDDNNKQQSYSELAESFPVELREKLISILKDRDKNIISYSISKDGVYVGEITFKSDTPGTPEIGIELEEPFQRQGIGYRLTVALMERYKQEHQVDYFVYRAFRKNIGSNALAKKLGGELINEKILVVGDTDFSELTYHIRHGNINK
ncbi:MAG: GNAT family N-acetyltransferase [Clostridia bacterium]|nr:GNAT family N-acetyltransferase [Clostridia bacterium]